MVFIFQTFAASVDTAWERLLRSFGIDQFVDLIFCFDNKQFIENCNWEFLLKENKEKYN